MDRVFVVLTLSRLVSEGHACSEVSSKLIGGTLDGSREKVLDSLGSLRRGASNLDPSLQLEEIGQTVPSTFPVLYSRLASHPM